MDASKKTYRMVVNEEIIFESDEYCGTHLSYDRNVIILNGFSSHGKYFRYPFNGAITDVNIWDKILNEKEVSNWSKCIWKGSGNVLDWTKATFQMSHKINIMEVQKSELCKATKSATYIAFVDRLQYKESIQFCKNIGGEVAVAKDEHNIEQMKISMKKLPGIDGKEDCPNYVFSGYLVKDGQYKSAISDEPLNFTYASNTVDVFDECLSLNLQNGTLLPGLCYTKPCSICVFKDWPVEFQLRGIKIEILDNYIDSHYYMINSSHIIGKSKSQIIRTKNGWNIMDGKRNVHFSNENKTFPMGVKPWLHSDDNKGLTKLNLRKLKQHELEDFCCDDGTCISEGLVLNIIDYVHW